MNGTDMICAGMRRSISESVHTGGWPEGELAAHMRNCGDCRATWETRQELVRTMAVMRNEAAAHRPSAVRRAELMREFAVRHQKPPVQRWTWAFAMAAVLLLMAGAGPRAWDLWNSPDRMAVEGAQTASDTDGQEGFIAVPYAPALASGEVLRVVRTELYPAALVSLGVDLDPSWTGKMPADLLVGEDGYPRAVRVSADDDGSN